MENDLLIDLWESVKQYIPAKDRQLAADHVANLLTDYGVPDETLRELSMTDNYMEEALSEYGFELETGEDEEE